jgi:type IV pilus assembly protein PilC
MPKYEFKALDAHGKTKKGTFIAGSRDGAKQKLRSMRLRPLSVKLVMEAGSNELDHDAETPILGNIIYKDGNGDVQIALGNDKPDTKQLIIFTKQFATMLKSGVPMIQALTLLAGQQQSRTFRKDLRKVRTAVENGATLSEALESYPYMFDNLYISMVKAGEASGNLDNILGQLVGYIERAAKIVSQIKSAMTYPTLVILVAILVIWALLAFVVPAMAQNFTDAGNELPGLTVMVMDLSNMVTNNWMEILGFFAFAVSGIILWKKSESGEKQFDHLILKIPVIGGVLKKIAVGRFCNTMSSMLNSGVNLLEALTICASSSGNKVIEDFILNVRESVEKGEKFSDPLRKGSLFPEMVVSMIAVGEETGKIDEMLTKVSDFYEEEVDIAVQAMLSLIEPILIVGIGGIVAVILLAMYLPMFDMAGNL